MFEAKDRRSSSSLILLSLLAVPAFAGTLHVPGQYSTIQAAIDAAADGDVVEIADGTYAGAGNQDLDFGGRAITVRSVTGAPDCVTIDCQGLGRGFYFHSGEGPNAQVVGITVTNGNIIYTGGTTDSDLELSFGGGAFCECSSPAFINCRFTRNAAVSGGGGGLFCGEDSSPTLTNCTIDENWGTRGGGIYCSSSSSPTFTNCTIRKNAASYGGGAGYCTLDSTPTLVNCIISRNTADNYGGGFFCYDADPALINCIIIRNHATRGGGFSCHVEARPTLTNCILQNVGQQEIYTSSTAGVPVVTYCLVPEASDEPWFGAGCIDVDPLLTPDGHLTAASPCINAGDPNGVYADRRDCDGETRVIDGRVDMGVDEWFDTDVDGLPNWWEQSHFGDLVLADPLDNEDGDDALNRDEYEAGRAPWQARHTFYVSIAGDDASDGLAAEWNGTHGPKETIQSAINACSPHEGDTVEIGCGTYTGSGNRDLDFNGRPITLRSVTGEPNCVIIDCQGVGRGLHIHREEGPQTIVEGLTIANGQADDDSFGGCCGGGMLCEYSDPTLINCAIVGNTAIGTFGYGGGIFMRFSSPSMTGCTISGNEATYAGGGVRCNRGSRPTLTNCTIVENTAGEQGGGIDCDYSSPAFTSCRICGNTALLGLTNRGGGGGVYSRIGNPTLTGCAIDGNVAEERGGGVYLMHADSNAQLTNCTLCGNSSLGDQYRSSGGGIYCYGYSDATLTNCTITGNAVRAHGGGVYCHYQSNPTLTNCVLWGNAAEEIYVSSGSPMAFYSTIQDGDGEAWFGTGCTDLDPLFVDVDGPDNDLSTWQDNDYHLSISSPCIDAGDPNFVAAGGETDIDGQWRVWDGNGDSIWRVDMGADELALDCPGDFDGSGVVDLHDLQLLLSHYGETSNMTPANGDLNFDGAVDLADLQILLMQYGAECE